MSAVTSVDLAELKSLVATYEEVSDQGVQFKNRLWALTEAGAKSPSLEKAIANHEETKKELGKSLGKIVKGMPMMDWAEGIKGFGPLSYGIILSHLGGDVIRTTPKFFAEGEGTRKHGQPVKKELVEGESFRRSIAQLRAYCGYGDPTRRRNIKREGKMTQEDLMAGGNPALKKWFYLVADGMIKAKNEKYTPIYYAAKEEYATHLEENGKPFSKGHAHACAVRKMIKALIKDMWFEWAKRYEPDLYEEAIQARDAYN